MQLDITSYFSSRYSEARSKFMGAAGRLGLPVASHVHPKHRGAEGEELAIDVVRIGPTDAPSLLVLSSGVHGAEGFCGSGCQVALLHDTELLQRFAATGVALLLVHAVNPYGFSHLRRVNEDSVDLNRNFLDFSRSLPVNEAYPAVHPLVLPVDWPPTADNTAAIARYVVEHGERKFMSDVSSGQCSHPDGLFFGGQSPAWSNTTLRGVLREAGAGCRSVAWIDIHTGLGVIGHGEKIFVTEHQGAAELARARACWGADVVSPLMGDSVTGAVRGSASAAAGDSFPDATTMSIALEFGTLDFTTVMTAMRGDQWLANHPHTAEASRRAIKKAVLEAFYIDSAEWRGMVCAQTRVAVLQALLALASPTFFD